MAVPRDALTQCIEQCLLGGDLERLFLSVLLWGSATAAPRDEDIGDGQRVRLLPLAELGGVPVFRVEWPHARPPTVAQRRRLQRELMQAHGEHLMVYITQGEAELLFVRARTLSEGRARPLELRTLPYTRGEPARTTIERLPSSPSPSRTTTRVPSLSPLLPISSTTRLTSRLLRGRSSPTTVASSRMPRLSSPASMLLPTVACTCRRYSTACCSSSSSSARAG